MRKRIGIILTLLAFTVVSVTSVGLGAKPTITWWVGSWKVEDGRAAKIAAEFEKQNPDYAVEVVPVAWEGMHEKELSALIAKNPPDVMNFTSSWGKEYASTGSLMDVSPLLTEIGRDKFYQAAFEWAKLNGKEYGVPYRIEAKVVFYNKGLFKKAGLSAPPQTWAQYASYAKKLTDAANGIYGIGLPLAKDDVTSGTYFRTVLRGYGGDFVSADGKKATLNTTAAIRALTYYRDLWKNKVLPPGTLSTNDDDKRRLFVAGKVAMMFEGPWGMKDCAAVSGLDYGLALIPGMTASKPGTWDSQGWSMGISAFTKNKDAAVKFVKLFVEADNDAYLTDALPAVRASGQAPRFATPNYQVFMKQMNYTHPVLTVPATPAIYQAVTVGLQRIFLGESVTKVANEVNKQIQALLNQK